MDEKALWKLTYGLFLLTAREGEKDNGCIVNTVIQVANDPVRISVAVIKKNYTCEMIERTGRFNVSALTVNTPFSVFQRFGMQSGRTADKFEGFTETERAGNGILYYTGANMLLSAEVTETHDLGSHMLFVAALDEGKVLSGLASCTYGYYQSDIKPKSAKPAPSAKKCWVCQVCGYVYEGDELPDDFECPVCHHGKADFALENPEPLNASAMKWVCPVCGYVYEGDSVPEGFKCPQCMCDGRKFLAQSSGKTWAAEHVIGVGKQFPENVPAEVQAEIIDGLHKNFNGECTEVGMYLAMARAAHREGYPEIGLYWEKAAYEEAEHAAKFAELLGELVSPSTKENLTVRVDAENGATAGKFNLAKLCKQYNLDALHDTIHEMARDEARHGKAFEGLLNRYFNK